MKLIRLIAASTIVALLSPPVWALLPAGFTEEYISSPRVDGSWNEAVGLTFSESGRMFVWERAGRVWIVDPDTPVPQPFIDISDEVLAWRDHGLLGFALHPSFDTTGYVYLLYAVDRNHLMNCDSAFSGAPLCGPGYIVEDTWQADQQYLDPPANTRPNPGYQKATIGRLIRLQAIKPPGEADYHHASEVDYASRRVLIGDTFTGLPKTGGIPLVYDSHGADSIAFGQDGTLIVSTGDSGSARQTDSGSHNDTYHESAVADGIIQPKENVGAFRSQLIDSMAGKILRIDASTGNGLESNPFFDPTNPRSAKSRVWALGLRQPFRITRKPGTGQHEPEAADPGVFYIGEVGWRTWESWDILRSPGQNFGWPIFEGMNVSDPYFSLDTWNQDAPNPLSYLPGCDEFFRFKDLIQQEQVPPSSFWNPCDPSQLIPPEINVFEHARPVLEWHHEFQDTHWGTFNETGQAIRIDVGDTYDERTVLGVPFSGSSVTGGVWYDGVDFPGAYRDSYFQGDYVGQWIRSFAVDANDDVLEVREFASDAGGVVALATHPQTGGIYYIAWTAFVKRISYQPNAPVAAVQADKTYGVAPLIVQFDSTGSFDPQGGNLTYAWDFGDGGQSTEANPTHTFNAPAGQSPTFDVTLTVQDVEGLTAEASLSIFVNNTPPTVAITSPEDGATYSTESPTTVIMEADIGDNESLPGELSCSWLVALHHNTHEHTEPVDNSCSTAATLSTLGCGEATYYYRIELTVTDPQGLTGTDDTIVQPDCAGVPDTTAPTDPAELMATPGGIDQIDLTWTGSTDAGGAGLAGYLIYRDFGAVPIAQVAGTSFSDTGLSPGSTHSYQISAVDNAAPPNESGLSNIASATTSNQGTVQFQNGAAPASAYAGARDAYLSAEQPDLNTGGETLLSVDGDDPTDSGLDKFALLAWDLSSLPSDSKVLSASITFEVSNRSDDIYTIFAVQRDWQESEATWNSYAAGMPWAAPGALGAGDVGTTVLGTVTAPSTGSYTYPLNADGVAVVQGWVDGTLPNYGIMLMDTQASNGLDVWSSEAGDPALRPQLSVEVEIPVMLGDLNDDKKLDVADVLLLQRALANELALNPTQFVRADLHPQGGDGSLDTGDLLALQALVLGGTP